MSMFIATFFLACVSLVAARPQEAAVAVAPIPIIVDERVPIDAGNYGFRIETGNGISFQETASALPVIDPAAPQLFEVVGSYSFTHPDGTVHTMTYVAGPQGFVPTSNMLPTPPPMPAHALEQILFAEEQKRLAAESSATIA